MNEVGRTVYTISGTTLENDKRKTVAKEALAAIKNELPKIFWSLRRISHTQLHYIKMSEISCKVFAITC